MTGPIGQTLNELKNIIGKALEQAIEKGELPKNEKEIKFLVERPADVSHGDFASNVAMATAGIFKKAPAQIANIIISNIDVKNSFISKVEMAGPGFLNFFLNENWFANIVVEILDKKEKYGRTDYGEGKTINVEYVSANPTGPMHMGNARGGAIGDGLAAVLDWCGYKVFKEFYINDAGNQIAKFGKSLEVRYLQQFEGEEKYPFPEDGYHGADITEHAKKYIEENGDKLLKLSSEERQEILVNYALPKNIKKMKEDLGKYRVTYDKWFTESTLHEDGSVKAIIKELTDKGLTYEKDGALWYKNAQVVSNRLKKEGKSDKQIEALELKDDVLVRANGYPTYFAADIAYHANKLRTRNFDKAINVWGADHHGHVARMQGAMDALGISGDRLDVVLMQLVRLVRDGEQVKMSKRTGNAITLTDLLEEIPIDAARFFFNMREPSSTLDFDLDLAISETSDNPVYYVQYAHARICSIIKNLEAEGIKIEKPTLKQLTLLSDPTEVDLIRGLANFPDEIILAAKNYDPAKITHYAVDIANKYHRFYNACRVKNEDKELMNARVNLCEATRQTLRNVFEMLKIDMPETM